MKKMTSVVLSASALLGVQAFAFESDDVGYLTPVTHEIREITQSEADSAERIELENKGLAFLLQGLDPALVTPLGSNSVSGGANEDLDEADLMLDKIINMGKKIWEIIAKNKPVVNVRTDVANALPEGLKGWDSLGGWQAPTAKLFRVQYKNLYGVNVVDFSFRILYTHGGNYNGKGRYLTHVTVVPNHLDVAWAYTFNMDSTVPSVLNTGSSQAPVAGMELLVRWSVDTVVKHSESSASYFVKGDGTFQNLTNGTAGVN